MSEELNGKRLMITGGTGSFGNAVLDRFLDSSIEEIIIFSRDEKKQNDMREKIRNLKVSFAIGDVRVKGFILLSTDKAVYPINTMGMTKAVAEKLMSAKARKVDPSETRFCATRYGNVMASRGSIIPLFVEKIKNNQPITITNPDMTRFLMSLTESVELVLHGFKSSDSGSIYVQKAPACTVAVMAKALKEIFESDVPEEIIGTRHGEKMHETLVSQEEMALATDEGRYFNIHSDNRDLNYASGTSDNPENIYEFSDYTSADTHILTVDEVVSTLLKLPYIQDQMGSR
jgi:UDP-N-acetylglucosamine 4,6-dehydratase